METSTVMEKTMTAKLTDQKVNGRYPFPYTHSTKTDIRKSIDRERKRLADAAANKITQMPVPAAANKVTKIKAAK